MPTLDLLRRSKIRKSFRVDQVRGMFDFNPPNDAIETKWHVNLPIEDRQWRIGAIVGPSGSGKSTLARQAFGEGALHVESTWDASKSILDGFPDALDTKTIVRALSGVGLSSPPHWLKPFSHLSNGQKFRAEIARAILSGRTLVVFDEFSSVVDRDVAKVCSSATEKMVRAMKEPQFVAVSCHTDILDWLQPDWVFDIGANRFEWRRLRRRPEIALKIHAASRDAWALFRQHHYLTSELSSAAQCFIATLNDRPVAFTSYLHMPHAADRRFKREHRTVVLPDYQGIGIGNRLSEWLGQKLVAEGWRFISTTSHPSMAHHRANSPLWRMTRDSSRSSKPTARWATAIGSGSFNRATFGFEFIGERK